MKVLKIIEDAAKRGVPLRLPRRIVEDECPALLETGVFADDGLADVRCPECRGACRHTIRGDRVLFHCLDPECGLHSSADVAQFAAVSFRPDHMAIVLANLICEEAPEEKHGGFWRLGSVKDGDGTRHRMGFYFTVDPGADDLSSFRKSARHMLISLLPAPEGDERQSVRLSDILGLDRDGALVVAEEEFGIDQRRPRPSDEDVEAPLKARRSVERLKLLCRWYNTCLNAERKAYAETGDVQPPPTIGEAINYLASHPGLCCGGRNLQLIFAKAEKFARSHSERPEDAELKTDADITLFQLGKCPPVLLRN